MKFVMTTTLLLLTLSAPQTQAQDYSVETIHDAAPADDLSVEIANQLAETGYRVLRNGSRAVWEFWPTKRWTVQADFVASPVRLYPFQPGELMGVVRLPRRGADFREQTLSRGMYTVRYALQPVDGNHVGTSPTQDFLVMVRAEDDTSPESIDAEPLLEASAEAAESSHPAMICLQKLPEDVQAPAIRNLEDREWWVLRVAGNGGDDSAPMTVDLVVVGHAEE